MANGLPLLKTGTSSFRKIRAEHRLYVDKTMYIPELINKGDVIFLSRPRRFGKSLTVSTLDSFFTGEKDLFRGLAAEKFMKSQEFVPKPVINLVMSRPSGSDSKEKLENGILTELRLNAKRYGVSLRGSDPADAFLELIREIKEVCSKNAVLLIDEYDAPVIKIVQNPGLSKIKDLLEDTRTVMSNFYSKIKDEDANLDFVFITGVTKFSRMGVFSTLNNIKDISLLPEFAALAGFTQEELENNFKPFIGRTADALDLGENVLLDKIRDYYDGFSFDGETRLYNPFSTMNFFGDMEFNNYWMESGSNTLLREMLRDKGLTVDQFKDLPVDKDFARSPGEIEKTPAHGFLYQAGYLTLRKKTDSSYALDYPNFEVLSSMSRLFIDNLFPSTVEAGQASLRLEEHVAEGDVPAIVDDIMILYSNLAYDDHAAAKRLSMFIALANDQKAEVTRLLEPAFGRRAILETTKKMTRAVDGDRYQEAISIMEHFIANSGQDKEIRMKLNESFYRSNLHSFLLGAGLRATPEIHSSLGRSDLAIEHKGLAYVIEMKVVEKASSAGTAAQNAIRQIVELGYAGRFVGPPILMSLVVAGDTRNIAACVFVKDGRAERLEFGGSLKKLSDKQPTKEKFDKKGQNKLPAVSQAKKTRAKKTVKDSKS